MPFSSYGFVWNWKFIIKILKRKNYQGKVEYQAEEASGILIITAFIGNMELNINLFSIISVLNPRFDLLQLC
jgi:hypothetical protein